MKSKLQLILLCAGLLVLRIASGARMPNCIRRQHPHR